MGTDVTTRAEIIAVMDEFRAAVEARDVERILSLYVPDADAVAIGTGRDEWYVGLDQMQAGLRRDFAQSEGFTLDLMPPLVGSAGEVAWLAAGFNGRAIVEGRTVSMHGRLTAIFRRHAGAWRIVHSHTSLPAAEQAEGRSFPAGA